MKFSIFNLCISILVFVLGLSALFIILDPNEIGMKGLEVAFKCFFLGVVAVPIALISIVGSFFVLEGSENRKQKHICAFTLCFGMLTLTIFGLIFAMRG